MPRARGRRKRNIKVWDVASGQCVHTLRGHNDEILDVSFNATGSRLVTASADGTSRVFNTMNGACQAILIGHEGEISKVSLGVLCAGFRLAQRAGVHREQGWRHLLYVPGT